MNPPDSKHSMNPNPNPNIYHPERGFISGTEEPGNWMSLMTPMTLILSIPPCLPGSTISTRNRNARSLRASMIPSRGTTRLVNPGSGHPDYQVQPDGCDLFGLCDFGYGEPSDSGSRWFSLVSPSNETTVDLATGYNEALVASVLNDLARLHNAPGNLLSRRWRCGSAFPPPTLEPLASAIS